MNEGNITGINTKPVASPESESTACRYSKRTELGRSVRRWKRMLKQEIKSHKLKTIVMLFTEVRLIHSSGEAG